MTTSGTTTFDLDLVEITEEAFERCGSELRSGYDFRTARRSLNLLFMMWANQGINMWAMEQGSQVLTAGTATYTLPADTVDLLETIIRTGAGDVSTQADLTISRISVSTYASIPNKLQTARPIQILVNRLRDAPTFTVWPVPDATTTYTLVYWRMRRFQDAGAGGDTMDVPFRFLPALVAGLAYHLALKIPNAQERLGILKDQYEAAWSLATEEDREKAPVRLVPRMRY